MFLTNCWYIAAWCRDVGRALVAHKIINQNLVFFRQQDGRIVALEDACPHRKLPLSKGRLLGDIVECGYHGMQFDCDGACVAVPTQDRIPPLARVRSYPVVEKWGFVWVWMGDPEQADEARIYQIQDYNNPAWGLTEGGTLEMACHYLWITDNLLDPSHVAWVHRSSFAAPGTGDTPLQVATLDDGVVVSRWIANQALPPYYAPLVKFEGNCDRLQHYEVRTPSVAINRSIFAPAGTGGNTGKLDDKAYIMVSYNFMTPIDDNHTRYFWLQHYNSDPHDKTIAKRLNDGAILAFNEDREILEGVHAGMQHRSTPNLNLGLDAGSLRYRKILDQAIAAEQRAALEIAAVK